MLSHENQQGQVRRGRLSNLRLRSRFLVRRSTVSADLCGMVPAEATVLRLSHVRVPWRPLVNAPQFECPDSLSFPPSSFQHQLFSPLLRRPHTPLQSPCAHYVLFTRLRPYSYHSALRASIPNTSPRLTALSTPSTYSEIPIFENSKCSPNLSPLWRSSPLPLMSAPQSLCLTSRS